MLKNWLTLLSKQLKSSLLLLQLFQLLKFSSVIITAVLMANFFPSIEWIKEYENLQLIGTTFSFFFISSLGETIIPFYESTIDSKKNIIIQNQFTLLILFSTLTFALILAYAYFWEKVNFELYFLYALAQLFNLPSFALESHYLRNKKEKNLVYFGIINFSLQIISIVLPSIFFGSIFFGILANLFFSVLKFIFCISQIKFNFNNIDSTLLKKYSKYSFPILISFLIGGSYVHLNAIITEYYLSPKEFVQYRFGAREFPLFLIIANSFNLIYSGKIADALKINRLSKTLNEYKQQNLRILHQLFPLAILLMLISKPIFNILYNNETSPAYLVFNLLLFLLLSRVLFPQTILFGHQKNRYFIWASLFELIVGLSLSIIWVKPFGLIGVCSAMIIAFMAEKLFLIAACYREKIPFFNFFPTKEYLLYSIGMTLVYLIF